MKYLKSVLSLIIVAIIPIGLMIWYRIHESSGFASRELILYPIVFGGSGIIIIYLLKQYFQKQKISDFNSGQGTYKSDFAWGLGLTFIYFVLFYIFRLTLANILPFTPNNELLGLMLDMRQNPILVLLWFGPVLWIGIALYEELVRVFVLTNLWSYSNDKFYEFISIVICALLLGFAHWSQGPYGMVTIALKSIVSGFYFYRKRRLMPLIYAHVLYDGLQVGILLLTYPG